MSNTIDKTADTPVEKDKQHDDIVLQFEFKTDREIIAKFTNIMSKMTQTCPDFPSLKRNYEYAAKILQEETCKHVEMICTLINAYTKQIASNIRFAIAQGFRANLDYVRHPVGNNFLQEDPEVFLNTSAMRQLPAWQDAQRTIQTIERDLDCTLQFYEDAVSEYFICLDVTCPSLAHYYGFLAANKILAQVEPGYQFSLSMTLKYKRWMQTMYNVDFSIVQDEFN